MESPQLFAEYHGLNLALPYTVADVKRSVNALRDIMAKEWLENRGTLPVMKYSGSNKVLVGWVRNRSTDVSFSVPDAPSLLDLSEVEMPQMYHADLNAADMRNVIHKAAGLPFYDLLSMFDGRMVGYTSHRQCQED